MLDTYIQALIPILVAGLLSWVYSFKKHNVNIVDSLWSIMFLLAALVYQWQNQLESSRAVLIFSLVSLWSIRLSIHLSMRNWGHAEDRRYQKIRHNNEPNFKFKSLYIIFGLQGILAWIISIPLLFSLGSDVPLSWFDGVAVVLWIIGFSFEAVSDYQLVQFKCDEANQQKVLDTGLWAVSRHPNYFGEFCIWWSFYLFSIPAGGWWTIYAPVLMSFLLLKVSGVVMLEKDISNRRPQYREYINSTNAFFPGPKKQQSNLMKEQKT